MDNSRGCYLWLPEPRKIPGAPPPGTPRHSGSGDTDSTQKNEQGLNQSARMTGRKIEGGYFNDN